MNDHDHEERAAWKLEQGGYHVTKRDDGYLLTSPESITELDTLAELVTFADAVYERVWTGRTITPSA
jgi:hypothetical protein